MLSEKSQQIRRAIFSCLCDFQGSTRKEIRDYVRGYYYCPSGITAKEINAQIEWLVSCCVVGCKDYKFFIE